MASIRGPRAIARGERGVIRLASGLLVGRLTSWEIVISPTTGAPTLKGEGAFRRYFVGQETGLLVADLTPSPFPAYVGRPRPPTPQTIRLRGTSARLTPAAITLASGEYL
jgi:hypothetical protein